MLLGQTRPVVEKDKVSKESSNADVKDEPSDSESESDNKEDETLVKIEEMKANCLEVKLETGEPDPLDITPYRIWSSKKRTRKH